MKFDEIPTGKIFTILECPSYPKLKTDTGYIDMRDKIAQSCDNLSFPVRVMEQQEVAATFNMSVEGVEAWVQALQQIKT